MRCRAPVVRSRLQAMVLAGLTALFSACAAPPPPAELLRTTPFVSGSDGYHTFRIPAIVVAGNGDLLAICEGRVRSAGDSGDIDTVMKRSRDGGRSWGPLQVIWDDGANTCGNPCVLRDEDTGVLWLLNTWNRGDDHERQIITGNSKDTRRVYVCSSSDDGSSWTAPREITQDTKAADWTWYATGPGAGIQLQRGEHKGRLLVPCDHIVGWEDMSLHYYSHVIFSDDHGATWRLGGTTPGDCVNECEVAEREDGALLLNMRSYDRSQKARQQAVSRDGGASWQEQRIVSKLIDPICQASLRRLNWPHDGVRGVLLFANAASHKRERMTVRASLDDGVTWAVARCVEAGPAAYSCLVALRGGDIGLLFETGGTSPYESIAFVRFPLPWLWLEPVQ